MKTEIQTEFCITGTNLSPMEITNYVGISPTRTWLAGDDIQGTRLKRKHNGWCLSKNREKSFDLAETIKVLLQVLLPKADKIKHICNQYALEAEFSCAVYIGDETPIMSLDQTILSKLVGLNAAIDIDIILTE